jgi:PHD/YefM family antitoxin component YafN of YafNO toxin-antitoxin module
MIKKLTIAEFERNMDSELDQIAQNIKDYIIIKRPKGKENVVILSQEAYNSIAQTKYLLESIQELNDGKTTIIKSEDLLK